LAALVAADRAAAILHTLPIGIHVAGGMNATLALKARNRLDLVDLQLGGTLTVDAAILLVDIGKGLDQINVEWINDLPGSAAANDQGRPTSLPIY
jgi:hypothetical protein